MLQRIFVHLVVACLISSTLAAQEKKGFEITGRIPGLKEGEKVLMTMFHGDGFTEFVDWTRTDSAIVKNGEFKLKGHVPDGPRWYYIYFDKHPKPTLRIGLDNNEIVTITSLQKNVLEDHGFIDDYVRIDGSPTAHSVYQFRNAYIFYQQLIGRLNRLLKDVKDSVGFDRPVVTGFMLAKEAANKTLFYNYLNLSDSSLIARPAGILFFQPHLQNLSGHASFLADFYNSRLDSSAKKSYYGQRWYEEAVKLAVGQPFPVFSFPDSEGKPVALREILSKSKLTLVNFWGTNSPLTKEYHDELRNIYKLYHDKGLNIIAVSSDDYEEAWKDHLLKEEYPWYNVLDKKGHVVDTVYHEFSAHPQKLRNVTNVLLDEQGKIIAWDPTGLELQWYLDKKFTK